MRLSAVPLSITFTRQAFNALPQAVAAVKIATKADPASVTEAKTLLAGVDDLVEQMNRVLCAPVAEPVASSPAIGIQDRKADNIRFFLLQYFPN